MNASDWMLAPIPAGAVVFLVRWMLTRNGRGDASRQAIVDAIREGTKENRAAHADMGKMLAEMKGKLDR